MIFCLFYMGIMALVTGVQCNIVFLPEAISSYTSSTANVDNYILQHQRQFEEQLRTLEKYFDNFRINFELRLEVIEYYDAMVDVKLRDLKDKLDPLEMLGDIDDVCVDKYRTKMPNYNTVKANLKTCIIKAKTAFSTLVNNPENTLKNIHNHYNNNFSNAMKECKKKLEKDETKYKSCVTTGVKNTNTYFTTNTNTFYTQMTAAECSSKTKIDETFDCYSLNIYQTFTAMGEVNGLIDNCLAGQDVCAACEIDNSEIIKGRCPYQMAWHLDDSDLMGDKIVNPFKGVNSTIPCVQVNFITKNLFNSVKKE